MASTIDVFSLHSEIMSLYKDFANSFIDIADEQIEEALEVEGRNKSLWPDPLIQFNPSYESGLSIGDLAKEGVLHPLMAGKIYRSNTVFMNLNSSQKLTACATPFLPPRAK